MCRRTQRRDNMKPLIFSILLVALAAVAYSDKTDKMLCGVKYDQNHYGPTYKFRKSVSVPNRLLLCIQHSTCNRKFIEEAEKLIAKEKNIPTESLAALKATVERLKTQMEDDSKEISDAVSKTKPQSVNLRLSQRPPKAKVPYNDTYPLTKPVRMGDKMKYRIALIADMDKASKLKDNKTWMSKLKTGWLIYDQKNKMANFQWDQAPITLKGSLAYGDRGMELSDLLVFDGRLLSFDDRTGVVYQIEGEKVIPWVLLNDGNGHTIKGFKAEWATVKDGSLYVGGHGTEWVNKKGEVISTDPQWVKVVKPNGRVTHIDWRDNYKKLCAAVNITSPGYLTHESGNWSPVHKQWFFLPRKASTERYDDKKDETRGTNLLLRASQNFKKILKQEVGPKIASHGFSSFKFLPNSSDSVAVAIKTEEIGDKASTFITMFDVADGQILVPETEVEGVKYEGIEFI